MVCGCSGSPLKPQATTILLLQTLCIMRSQDVRDRDAIYSWYSE